MRKIFLLIDGDSVLFKSFYALVRSINHFTNHDGLHTNGIYEFNIVLNKLLSSIHPDYALIAWDAGSTTFRTKMYADYKGQRSKTPSALKEQFQPTMNLVKAHGIKNYELKNYEADDIVGTMAHKADQAGLHTIIITGDRDYTQLCSKLTTVYLSKRGITHLQKITPGILKKMYDLTPQQIVDKKALQGDSSDNYPGVPGIGTKGALKLIQKYGSVEGVYKNLPNITAKAQKRHLIKGKLEARLSKELAQIDLQTPVTIKLSDCKYNGMNKDKLVQIYQKLDFKKFLNDLD